MLTLTYTRSSKDILHSARALGKVFFNTTMGVIKLSAYTSCPYDTDQPFDPSAITIRIETIDKFPGHTGPISVWDFSVPEGKTRSVDFVFEGRPARVVCTR